MSRFSDRLKLSVSAAALMGGSLVAASSARAVTITGTQTSASVTNLTEDAVIAGTGIISPNGLFVQNHVGNLINNGLVEGIVTTDVMRTAGSADFAILTTALEINGGLDGNFANNGTIAATATGAGSYNSSTGSNPTHDLDATANAVDITGGLTGDFGNSNDITADATLTLDVVRGTEAMPLTAGATVNDDLDAYARAVYINSMTDGTFTNTSPLTISASASSSTNHIIVADGANIDVNLSDIRMDAGVTGVEIRGGTYDFDNSGTISSDATVNAVVDVAAQATTGLAAVSVDLTRNYAQAYPVLLSGTNTGFTNSGTITGTANATGDVDADVDGAGGADVDLNAGLRGYVSAVYVNDLDGDFTNSGTISADSMTTNDATVTAVAGPGAGDANIDFDSKSERATAYAVYLETLAGDFDNSGTITASGTISRNIAAMAASQTGLADIDVNEDGQSDAYGVYIGNFDGTEEAPVSLINTSDLTISADASSNYNYDLDAVGADASVDLNDVDQDVSAYGVDINNGTFGISNSGTISATAAGAATIDATATVVPVSTANPGTDADASLRDLDVDVFAFGVQANGTATEFANSGSISADASYAADLNLAASGQTRADVSGTNTLVVYASGVFLNSLQGDFDNSGTISASSVSDVVGGYSAVAADGYAELDVREDQRVESFAVFLQNFNGDLTNSSTETISATASLNSVIDVVAVGTSASVSLETQDYNPNARGLLINNGEYGITNTGAINAEANGAVAMDIQVTASEAKAKIDVSDLDFDVTAIGIDGSGTADSFANSGTISATGSATLTQTLVASGETSAEIDLDNDVAVDVAGVVLVNTLDGNFSNTGSIAADGSLAYTGNISSTQMAGPDFVDIDNDFDATVIGVNVDFVADPGEGEMPVPTFRTFTNEGDLTASGTLTIAQTVVAGAQDVPTDTMAAPSDTPTITTDANLTVIAGKLTGGLGTVTNSGTVAASGTVDSADADSMVVGLYLPDAEDGFVITNSGDVSASLDGTTGTALVAAIKIGSEDTQQPASETGEPEDPGLITINNSGTISATNTTGTGTAYGIDIMNAPEPVTINQSDGSINAPVAIAMDQGTDDILNWTGGTIHGLVDADAGDVVNVFGGGLVMAPTDFAIDGVGTFNVGLPGVTPTTTPLPDTTTFMMLGSMSNTGTLDVNPLGNLYVGVPAVINVDEFNMNGDATTLTIDVQPGAMGGLTVNGDANLDGTLTAAPKVGLYLDTETHTIIQADADGSNGTTPTSTATDAAMTALTTPDGVNDAFDAVTGDTLLLEFSATINPTSVDLTYNRVPFDQAGGIADGNANALSVAQGLEAGYDPTRVAGTGDPELNDILSNLFVSNDADAYRNMLFSWAGSEHAQMIGAAVGMADPYFMAVSEHLNDTRLSGSDALTTVHIRNGVGTTLTDPQATAGQSGDAKRASFWGRAIGNWSDRNGDANASGFDEEIFGVVIGLDYLVTDNVKIGIAAAYTDNNIDFDNGAEGDIERFTIGGYVSAVIESFYVDASFSYADDDYEVSRWGIYGGAACPTFDCVMNGIDSSYNGDAFLAHGEVGYILRPGNTEGGVVIQPFLGINHSNVDIDGFSESGFGDLSLDVAGGGGESTQLRLGTRISTNWNTNSSTVVRPELRVEWRHEFENDPQSFNASLAGAPGVGFTTIGSEMADDLFVIGAGATAEFENGIGAFFEYQGAFGSSYDAHSLQLGARVKF